MITLECLNILRELSREIFSTDSKQEIRKQEWPVSRITTSLNNGTIDWPAPIKENFIWPIKSQKENLLPITEVTDFTLLLRIYSQQSRSPILQRHTGNQMLLTESTLWYSLVSRKWTLTRKIPVYIEQFLQSTWSLKTANTQSTKCITSSNVSFKYAFR